MESFTDAAMRSALRNLHDASQLHLIGPATVAAVAGLFLSRSASSTVLAAAAHRPGGGRGRESFPPELPALGALLT